MLAAPIGLLRIPARILGFRLAFRPWRQMSGRVFRGALVQAFVASVPGNNRSDSFVYFPAALEPQGPYTA